jgi:hypothetical protein
MVTFGPIDQFGCLRACSGVGDDHPPHVLTTGPAHGLEQRIVLGIDRQHGRPGGGRAPHEQAAGANQALLVGERDDGAALGGGECGFEPRGPGDRTDHPLRRALGGLDDSARPGRRFDAGAGERVFQFAIGGRIADRGKTGAELARKRSESCRIGIGAERLHPIIRALALEQIHGAGADRAGRAKDGHAAFDRFLRA